MEEKEVKPVNYRLYKSVNSNRTSLILTSNESPSDEDLVYVDGSAVLFKPEYENQRKVVATHSMIKIIDKELSQIVSSVLSIENVGELFENLIRFIPEGELRKWDKNSFVTHIQNLIDRNGWDVDAVRKHLIYHVFLKRNN